MRVVVAQEQLDASDPARQTLLSLGLECGHADCVSFGELPVRLAQGPVDLVLLRVGAEQAAALDAIDQAVALTGAPVLVVGPTTDARHILQTTRSGARGYLDETRLEEDLASALEKLRLTGSVPQSQGLVVSVISATPGSGVTTVATNLAFTWGQKYPERVALVELGRECPDMALSLDLKPRHTVAEVAEHWQRMDAALLRQSMVGHAGGVAVLAYRPETLAGEPIEPQAVRRVIILMRTMYAAAVLNLGHLLAEEHYEAMRLSDRVAVVVRLDVPALRQARQLLTHLNDQGVARDRIQLVANRYGQRGQINWRMAEEAVGTKFAEYIPEDSGNLNQALNQGQPLVSFAAGQQLPSLCPVSRSPERSAYRQAVRQIAHGGLTPRRSPDRRTDSQHHGLGSLGEVVMIRATSQSPPVAKDPLALHFQKLKSDIHRQLVEGLDISRLHQIKPERLRREVRELAIRLTQSSPEMLNELERERLVSEIMDEAFGLGPLEGPMNDPTVSDILVNGPREVYLERHGRWSGATFSSPTTPT